jgi:hypothetical protein
MLLLLKLPGPYLFGNDKASSCCKEANTRICCLKRRRAAKLYDLHFKASKTPLLRARFCHGYCPDRFPTAVKALVAKYGKRMPFILTKYGKYQPPYFDKIRQMQVPLILTKYDKYRLPLF